MGKSKAKKKTGWLNKGGFDTVIMVNPTSEGELSTRLQCVINDNPGPVKIKIQEQGGIQVKTRLQKTNPGRTKGCNSEDCLACKHGRGKGGECRRNNVGYTLICDLCGGRMYAMLGRLDWTLEDKNL